MSEIVVTRLTPVFAARVDGVDITRELDAPAWARVRAAFEEHSVLVFRGQALDDERQVAFSRRFGNLEVTRSMNPAAGTPFARQSNLDIKTGDVIPAGDRRMVYQLANMLWHTDSSFKQIPALASVLSARTLPGAGGETEFASTRLAWQRLEPALRAQLESAYAWHSYAHSRGKIDPTLSTAVENTALPPVHWRLTWRNPANGRVALYVASHAFAIDGMDKGAAQALLATLIDAATRPELTYLHRWRPGDAVMWDNRAILHRGRPWPDDQPRHMVRTTISARDVDGLDFVRPAVAAA